MKKILFLLVFIIVISGHNIHAQTKNDDILKLLSISETGKIAEQTLDLLIPQFQQLIPGIPDIFWIRFRSKLNINALLLECIPAYNKYYTHDEIKQLLIFYESPLGRKMIEVAPFIQEETMYVGQQWGEQLGYEIVNELIREGFLEE